MPSCEQTPLLQPWGELAPIIVQLINVHPALAERLIFAPIPALHAYAIAIYRDPKPTEIGKFAARIYQTRPRDLLREVWPDHAPDLWAALRRASSTVWHQSRYESLNGLLLSNAREYVLNSAHISPMDVTYFGYARCLDPLIIHATSALERNIERAKTFDLTLSVLRRLKLLSSNEENEVSSLRLLSTDGLGRWIKRRLAKVTAPPDGIEFALPVLRITTGKEMLAIAREAQNCLGNAQYLLALGTGQMIFIKMAIKGQLVVASMSRGFENWFMLEEVQGQQFWANTEFRREVVCFLRGSGVDVMDPSIPGVIGRLPMDDDAPPDEVDDT